MMSPSPGGLANDPDSEISPTRSEATIVPPNTLPPGCTLDPSPCISLSTTEKPQPIIWVDHPPSSPTNPFFFPNYRKNMIIFVAIFFTFMTAYNSSAYSIGISQMCEELGCSVLEGNVGIGLYAWGFGITPLVLAPLSEEFGRKWTYVTAVFIFWMLYLMTALGQNTGTILVGRFLIGAAGSVGATLVGGTISDIYVPAKRGLPSSLFALCAVGATGLGPATMSYVVTAGHLGWRWISWIQFIILAGYFPFIIIFMPETRSDVLLRRRAAKLRKERRMEDGGRYTARSEITKVSFGVALRSSLSRPLLFLVVEPIVGFFSVWLALAWGVFYTQISGLSYIFEVIYGFNTNQVGLIFLTATIGSILGFIANLFQEALYRRKCGKRGVEARLYAPMLAGVGLPIGCFIYGFTSTPSIHWIVPCIGLIIIIASIMIIYICNFTYLAECYGSHASSAIAGQSFLRNMVGGAFAFFTHDMFVNITPRWAIFIFGCIAAVLGAVPFIAFFYGPQIRARSKYSRELMAEERARIGEEKGTAKAMMAENRGERSARQAEVEGV